MIEKLKDQMTATFGNGRVGMTSELNKIILSQTDEPYPTKRFIPKGDMIILKFINSKGLDDVINFLIKFRELRNKFLTRQLAG